MKTTFLSLSLVCIIQQAYTQVTDTTKTQVTNIEIGPIKIKINEDGKETNEVNTESIKIDASSDKEEKKSRVSFNLGVDYGLGGYIHLASKDPVILLAQPDLSLDYSKSRNLAFNGHISYDFHKNIGLVTGLRYSKMMFRYANVWGIDPNNGNVSSGEVRPLIYTGESFYQLNVHYFQVPLMLKIQTNNKNFKVAGGVLGGWKIKDIVRHEYQRGNVEGTEKIDNVIEANAFDLALTGRITYKDFGFYGTVSLTDLYENHVKHGLSTPFSVGLTLGGF